MLLFLRIRNTTIHSYIVYDLGYVNNETFNQLESDVEEISKMISAMASLRSIFPASRL